LQTVTNTSQVSGDPIISMALGIEMMHWDAKKAKFSPLLCSNRSAGNLSKNWEI
jgi:hypothetical protein